MGFIQTKWQEAVPANLSRLLLKTSKDLIEQNRLSVVSDGYAEAILTMHADQV